MAKRQPNHERYFVKRTATVEITYAVQAASKSKAEQQAESLMAEQRIPWRWKVTSVSGDKPTTWLRDEAEPGKPQAQLPVFQAQEERTPEREPELREPEPDEPDEPEPDEPDEDAEPESPNRHPEPEPKRPSRKGKAPAGK